MEKEKEEDKECKHIAPFKCIDKHLGIAISNLQEMLVSPNKREGKVKIVYDQLADAERHAEKYPDFAVKLRDLRKNVEKERWKERKMTITPEQIDNVREEIKTEGERKFDLILGKTFIQMGEKLLEKETKGIPFPSPKPLPAPEPSPDDEMQRYYALKAQRNKNANKPLRRLIDGIRPGFLEVVRPYKRKIDLNQG